MKITLVFTIVLLLACLHDSSAWWGGGSKSSSSSNEKSFANKAREVGDRVVKNVADAGRFAAGAAKGTFAMGKAYK